METDTNLDIIGADAVAMAAAAEADHAQVITAAQADDLIQSRATAEDASERRRRYDDGELKARQAMETAIAGAEDDYCQGALHAEKERDSQIKRLMREDDKNNKRVGDTGQKLRQAVLQDLHRAMATAIDDWEHQAAAALDAWRSQQASLRQQAGKAHENRITATDAETRAAMETFEAAVLEAEGIRSAEQARAMLALESAAAAAAQSREVAVLEAVDAYRQSVNLGISEDATDMAGAADRWAADRLRVAAQGESDSRQRDITAAVEALEHAARRRRGRWAEAATIADRMGVLMASPPMLMPSDAIHVSDEHPLRVIAVECSSRSIAVCDSIRKHIDMASRAMIAKLDAAQESYDLGLIAAHEACGLADANIRIAFFSGVENARSILDRAIEARASQEEASIEQLRQDLQAIKAVMGPPQPLALSGSTSLGEIVRHYVGLMAETEADAEHQRKANRESASERRTEIDAAYRATMAALGESRDQRRRQAVVSYRAFGR